MGLKSSAANLLGAVLFHATSRNILGVAALASAANETAAFQAVPTESLTATTRTFSSSSSDNDNNRSIMAKILRDLEYPGTAVERILASRERVHTLQEQNKLTDRPWSDIRRSLLWAAGLKDLPNAVPGQGYTGHAFNDYNHVDATQLLDQVSDNENQGRVAGIAPQNRLGNGIRVASLPELGPGGSWSTCAMGCHHDPPRDVAHLQFQARIAFKLVWVPNAKMDVFCLVDDDGKLLATGKPLPGDDWPALRERQMNYRLVQGSKYATEVDKIATAQQGSSASE